MSLWEAKACRSCLTVKGKLEKIGDASKRQYVAITGLQISENDGYPPYFCMECRHHIRKSLAFRRKSRRAHFVLKEIMTVRKQVSYSDIITVNRKRTNLESSLNFWEPNNNACYLITNGEGEEPQEELQKYDLQPPKYTRSYSTHLIDIKPDHEEPVTIEIPVEKEQEIDDVSEDIPTNDYLEPDSNIPDIDMNDVFKDLPEEENESESEGKEDEPLELFAVRKQARAKFSRWDSERQSNNYSIITVAEALTNFDLKALTLEEQKERMERRKKAPRFANAPFKCSMCLTVYRAMAELLEHVKYHNSRQFDHECRACKNKYTTAEELTIHIANDHMYEYTCRMCRVKCYRQSDAVKHSRRSCLENADAQAPRANGQSNDKLKSFTLTPMTQQMMYDVMALRGRLVRNKGEDELFSEESRYNCDICNGWFKERRGLVQHMNNRHRFTYTCNVCMEVFTVRDQAITHGHTHDDKERFECKPCGLEFDGEAKFKRHERRKHNVTRIPCNVCGFSALHESALYKHQIGVHKYVSVNDPLIGDPNHKCEQCGVQFKDRCALETHLVKMNHTGVENVQFACVPCKKIFMTEDEADSHSMTCIIMRRKKYPRKCCYCSEMLTSSMAYRSHYYQMHPTLPYRYLNRNAICDVCGKSVLKSLLAGHLRSHVAGALSCRLCGCELATAGARVAHVLSAHARAPYRCALCSRRFRFRSDCRDHILKVHAPTMLYKCEFCSQEFSYFRHLKQHSESLHNLVIPPTRSRLQFKSKTKIYVYAHMKIYINEVEKPMVEQAEVELVDYLEQKSKRVDYSDYFVFTSEADSQEIVDKRRKRRKKKVNSELEAAVANITVQWPEQNVTYDPESVKNEEMKEGIKVEVKEGIEVEVKEGIEVEVKKEVKKKVKKEVKKKVKKEVKKEKKDENVEVAQEMELDVEMPLEVIENEGSQYVMIDGEMYRIACEDEVE